MRYEETPVKATGDKWKKVALKEMDMLSTWTIIQHLVKRHRVGLLGTWAVITTTLYLFPPLTDVLLSIVKQ